MAKAKVETTAVDYDELAEDLKGLKKHEPSMNSAAHTGLEMDDHGNFRISVNGVKGMWTLYQGIATLELEGVQYLGVSAYYDGNMPIEQVLKVEVVPTVKA